MKKFDELNEAMKRDVDAFQEYEKDCGDFIRQLREGLVEYLECPDDRVSMVIITDSNEEKGYVERTRDKQMVLYDDAFYRFAFHIELRPKGLYIHLRVKSEGKKSFRVKVGDEQILVDKSSPEAMKSLTIKLFDVMKDHLENEFSKFMTGGIPLGFLKS